MQNYSRSMKERGKKTSFMNVYQYLLTEISHNDRLSRLSMEYSTADVDPTMCQCECMWY